MSIKTEILNNLITQIKTNFPEFKKVERGLVFIDDKSNLFPMCVLNSVKTIINREQTTFNRVVKNMTVFVDILHKSRSNYYIQLDDLEERFFTFIDNLDYNQVLHTNVINLVVDEIEEVINDEYVDGFYHLRFILNINYFV